MTKKKGEFTVLRNIRAGMVIILLIYIGLIFQSKGRQRYTVCRCTESGCGCGR